MIKNPSLDEKIPCEVCLKEIPETVDDNAEAVEYVTHYCGLECYQKWKKDKLPES